MATTWQFPSCTSQVTSFGDVWCVLQLAWVFAQASNPEDTHWLMSRTRYRPVLEYCGCTEIGGAFCGGTLLHPCIPSAFATCTLGMDLLLLNDPANDASKQNGGSEARTSAAVSMSERRAGRGEVAVRAPALGLSQRLLNRDHFDVYYQDMPMMTLHGAATRTGGGRHSSNPGEMRLRRHGDEFEVLPGSGFFRAHGRCDDTMNLGGIKVGSVEIERVCVESVSAIDQAAAVAVPPAGGGPDSLHLFLVLQKGAAADSKALQSACQRAVRERLNPLFKVGGVSVCAMLPRNASNKVMRRVLRDELVASRHATAKM